MTLPFARRCAAAVLGLALAFPSLAFSQGAEQGAVPAAVELAIGGRVEHPRSLSLTELQAMPPVTVEVHFVAGHGEKDAVFTGALLWELVEAAAPTDEAGGHARLQHTLLARGRDGYAVALAVGELDPNFEGKQVVVAYVQDGKPVPALRLVVPGDARPGRSVRDLVSIEVR